MKQLFSCHPLLMRILFFLLLSEPSWAQNYFAGTGAGTGNTGTNVTGVGAYTIASSNSGAYLSAFGYKALNKNTTGVNNTAIGSWSLSNNTWGSYNTSIGMNALTSLTNGHNNTAIGSYSMQSATITYHNTALGVSTLSANTGGGYNTAIGSLAMQNSVNGGNNIAIGYQALYGSNGSYNIGIGSNCLLSNNAGQFNVSTGLNSSLHNTSGNNNTISGSYSFYANTTGSGNTASGYYALVASKTGNNNTAIGDHAGAAFVTLNNCSFLGAAADASVDNLSNATAIGYQATVDSDNKVVIGNTAITSIGGQVGWTTYSDQRLKTDIQKSKLGLDFILSLNPVTYHYKAAGQQHILYTGLIAQEVDAAAQKAGISYSGVDKNGTYWGIRYAELTVPLIKALQEMNDKTTALEARIAELETKLAQQENNPASVKTSVVATTSNKLFQNQPNPFTQSTRIGFQLNSWVRQAAIVIRNINGALVKQVSITPKNTGEITIAANELAAGTYTYTLVVDNESVETRLMVLVK